MLRIPLALIAILLLASCNHESPTAPREAANEVRVNATDIVPCVGASAYVEPDDITIPVGSTALVTMRLCFGGQEGLGRELFVSPESVARGKGKTVSGDTYATFTVHGVAPGTATVYYSAWQFGRAPSTRPIGTVTVHDTPRRRSVRH